MFYLLILWGHSGHEHTQVFSVPDPGVAGEVFQHHHGFVETIDCLHHPGWSVGQDIRYKESEPRQNGELH